MSAAPPAASPPGVGQPAAGLPSSLAETLADLLARLGPAYPARSRESRINGYMEAVQHKALAVFPPGASWRTMGWASSAQAEERVLEACQARNGGPCILLAVNETAMRPPTDGKWLARAMPRVAYDGLFDPAQLPAAGDGLRRRADVVGYRDLAGPKAAAFHPWGRLFIASDPASQRTAETRALAACNDDPGRKGEAGPCLLCAAGDQVVLGKRSTAPLAAQ